jgi:hypothetical protein
MTAKAARGACVAILLLGVGLSAQKKNANQAGNTRNLEGFVTDASGQHVAKAVVQLKNTKNLQIRSFITQDDGSYHFMGLSADVEYAVKAEHDGAASSWKNLSIFDSKKAPVINLKLKMKK